jgi:hypothetical protein
LCLILVVFLIGCKEESDPVEPTPTPTPPPTRAEAIPDSAVKQTPAMDVFPPVVHSLEFDSLFPLEGPVNTAGAEDAPVMAPDGKTFFFFTPDVSVPSNQQLLDSVTGIWWTRKVNNVWTEPERILLNNDLALDGPFCIQGDTLWFGSIRVGNYLDDGDIYTAEYRNGRWENWQNAGAQLNSTYNIGELYTSRDGQTMYFHRPDSAGSPRNDLWKTERSGNNWSEPVSLGPTVNTTLDESRPCLSSDGNELWFTGDSRLGYTGPALYRTTMTDSGWSAPEEIFSNFAGDPGLDDEGNVYFTHHFFDSSLAMIEADIYVARKR